MIITVDPDRGFHERVMSAVAGAPWARSAFHVADTQDAGPAVAAHAEPTVVIIGPHVSVPAATNLTARLVVDATPTFVLLVTEPTTDVLRQAMRAGARDVLAPNFDDDELRSAVERTGLPELAGTNASSSLTVAVFSAKGGVGTSTVAANLVVRLAERFGENATMIDLDVGSADQAIMHALNPQWTLQELADGTIGLDTESLAGVLLPVEGTEVSILPGPLDPALAETISGDAAARIIGSARSAAPVVVLDTSSAFDDRTLAAVDAADVIVVVSSLDVAALRALTVSLQTLSRIGIDPASIRLALVRADSKSGLQVSDVERSVGREIDARIPSSRAVVRSVNEGVPLALGTTRSSFVQAIDELVDSIVPAAPAHLRRAAAERDTTSSGWFGLGRSRGDESSRPAASRSTTDRDATTDRPDSTDGRSASTTAGSQRSASSPGGENLTPDGEEQQPTGASSVVVAVDGTGGEADGGRVRADELEGLPPPNGGQDESSDGDRGRLGRWR